MKNKNKIMFVGIVVGMILQVLAVDLNDNSRQSFFTPRMREKTSKAHFYNAPPGVTTGSAIDSKRRKTISSSGSFPSSEDFGVDENLPSKTSPAISGKTNPKILNAEGLSLKDDVKIEYGDGAGETSDEALREAMKDVLQKVVGIYVDSDFRMNNDKIIKDEIITHSNGFIDHYKKMEESEDANGRGKVITIKAWVKIRDFVNRMKMITPSQKVNIDGALINTHLENDINAETLLRKELDSLDPTSLFEIRLLESFHPEVVSVNDDIVTMRYLYVIRYSNDRYYKSFLPRIKSVLNQIALKKTNETASFSIAKIGMYPKPISTYNSPKNVWKDRPQPAYICKTHLPVWDGDHAKKTVAVTEKITKGGNIILTRWKLSERHISVFCNNMKNFVAKQTKVRCVFSLFDGNKNVVSRSIEPVNREVLFNRFQNKESTIPDFMPLLPGTRAMSKEDFLKASRLSNEGGSFIEKADRFIGYIDIKVDKADVKRIKAAEIKLETDVQESDA